AFVLELLPDPVQRLDALLLRGSCEPPAPSWLCSMPAACMAVARTIRLAQAADFYRHVLHVGACAVPRLRSIDRVVGQAAVFRVVYQTGGRGGIPHLLLRRLDRAFPFVGTLRLEESATHSPRYRGWACMAVDS